MIEDKRKALALVVGLAACLLLMCSEKDGSLSPDIETDPPQYLIEYLTPSPAKIEPNGEGSITARVVDREYEPVEGKVVNFTATKGTIDNEVTTGSDGIAEADYTAPSEVGYVEITAQTEGAAGKSVYVQIGEGALQFGQPALMADGVSYGILTLTVTDDSGNPVEGASVEFSTDYGYIVEPDPETSWEGKATAKLVSEVSKTDLTATITADISYSGMEYTEIAMVSMLGVTLSATASPSENPADGVSTSSVSALLKLTTTDSPLGGYQVFFSTSLGAIDGSAYTNSGGIADVYLVSPTTPGVANVIARYGGHSDTVQVTFGELTLRITPALTRMVADGLTYQPVYATLLTEDNNPVVGAVINFATTHGVITRSGATDMWGDAVGYLTSATYASTATVTASFEGMEATTQVSFEVPQIALKATPMSLQASPSVFSTVSAYVSFSDGSPVPDSTLVRLSTTEGSIEPLEFTESGIVYTRLYPQGVASNDVTVTATSGGASATANMVFIPGLAVSIHTYAVPDTIVGDGSAFSTIVAEVRDGYGNYVEDGTNVNFSLMSGSGVMAPTAITSSGIATVEFLPVGGSYTANIRAEANSYFDEAAVDVVGGSPGAIYAEADTGYIQVAGSFEASQTNVVALVTDGSENPVEDGTEVEFEIIDGPGGGEYLDSPSSGYGPVTKMTAAGGALAVLNAGTKPGTVVIKVSADGIGSAAVPVGISSDYPDGIIVSVGDVVRIGDGSYTMAVTALVRDQWNNPVENGTPVYFTLDDDGLGFINPESTTGDLYPCLELQALPIKGIARACFSFVSESIFQEVDITASTAGGAVEDNFNFVIPIMSPTMTVEAMPASLSGASGGLSTISVVVWDSYMHSVANAGITFTVDGPGSVFPTYSTTTEFMPAMTTYTLSDSTEAGTATIKAHLVMTDVQGEAKITITE